VIRLDANMLGTALAHEGIEPPDDMLERIVTDLNIRLGDAANPPAVTEERDDE